ncbi:MAG: alpha/beta fold hydrolase [Acidimicrobiales bacterium]
MTEHPPITTSIVPSTDGVDVVVHDFGGDGPLLVLCHATGFCARVWEPFVEALGGRYRCIAPDFRAHGATELPPGVELVWTGMAADLLAVVDAYRGEAPSDVSGAARADSSAAEPVLAVGHSMGASAMILAEAARPGTFERAWSFEPILLEAGPKLVGDDIPEIAVGAGRRRARFESRAEALERWSARPPLSVLDERALRAYAEFGLVEHPDGGVELACSPTDEAAVFQHHCNGSFERSGDLRIPFVIGVSGDEDGPAAWATSAAIEHPHLALVSYPDLTHFGPLQEPDRLAVDVGRFLDEGGTRDS